MKTMRAVPYLVGLLALTACLGSALGGQLIVKLGEPRQIAQYAGSERDYNRQAFHFCGMQKAGDNLIALYRMRPDELVPDDVDLAEYYAKDAGYHVSSDNGRTWSTQQFHSYGGQDGGTLADGTVLIPWIRTEWVGDHVLHGKMHRSDDGGRTWTTDPLVVQFPQDHTLTHRRRGQAGIWFWCSQIVEIEPGTLIATMNGNFMEVGRHVSVLVASSDGGRRWDYLSTIAGNKPCSHQGYYGTGLTLLSDGSLLAVAQTEYANPRILVQCRSSDGGRTWTDPVACPGIPGLDPNTFSYTRPDGKQGGGFSGAYQHPRLLRMENGVLALSCGRPGIQIALSSDGRGQHWDKIVNVLPPTAPYSYCAGDVTSGKPGMVAIGRDRLLLLYDVYSYAKNSSDPRLNTVFVREITVSKGER